MPMRESQTSNAPIARLWWRAIRSQASLLFAGVLMTACAQLPTDTSTATAAIVARNAELAEIRRADQADRQVRADKIDWSLVAARDKARLSRVREIITAGGLRTAEDYYDAALVCQHGETVDDIRLAYALATISAAIDPKATSASWLTAAAWDRIMMRMDKPQWYGTQFRKGKEPNARWELYNIDETVVTDEQRKALGVPSLEQARARARRMNE